MKVKFILFYIVILIIGLANYGKVNSQDIKKDTVNKKISVQSIWKDTKNIDKIETYLKKEKVIRGSKVKANEFKFFITKAKELKRKDLIGKANKYFADYYRGENGNDVDSAIKYYKIALKYEIPPLYKAHVYLNLGVSYTSIGEPTTALEYYVEAVAYAEANLNKISDRDVKDIQMICYSDIATIHRAKNNVDIAVSYLEKALKISIDIDTTEYCITLLRYIPTIYMKDHNIVKCEKLINDNETTMKNNLNPVQYGLYLIDIAGIYTEEMKSNNDIEKKKKYQKIAQEKLYQAGIEGNKTNYAREFKIMIGKAKSYLYIEMYDWDKNNYRYLDSAYNCLNIIDELCQKEASSDFKIAILLERVLKKILLHKTNKGSIYKDYLNRLFTAQEKVDTLLKTKQGVEQQKEILKITHKSEIDHTELLRKHEQEQREKTELILIIVAIMSLILIVLLLLLIKENKKKKEANTNLIISNKEIKLKSQQIELAKEELEKQNQKLYIKSNELHIAHKVLEEFNTTLEEKINLQNLDLDIAKKELMIIDSAQSDLLDKMEFKKKELLNQTMVLVEKNNFLEQLKKQISKIDDTSDSSIITINSGIDKELRSEKYWNTFDEQFKELDFDFSKKLFEMYDDLTLSEYRICQLIKLNMKNKDISNILSLSLRTVETHRTNIRKKMDLQREDSLYTALSNL